METDRIARIASRAGNTTTLDLTAVGRVQSQQMRIYPVVLLAFSASALLAEKKPVTIDALTERPGGRGGGTGGAPVWAPDGKRFAFTQGAKIVLYDVPSKSQKDLVSLEPMDAAAVAPPEPAVFGCHNPRLPDEPFHWSSTALPF